MQKRAVLDLGTNTFHLLIAEVSESSVRVLYQDTIAVKLGEGGINHGFIAEAAFRRGIDALERFAEKIEQYSPNKTRAVGTAALRTAANGTSFIEEAESKTGIKIELIDGGLEARLIYEGVKRAVKLDKSPVLILDIGGGSTEFIIADNETIFWKKSYPLGAAKLMDRFHKHDPIGREEIEAVHQHMDEYLQELKNACSHYKPQLLIGSAGAFETFAVLAVHRFKLPQELLLESEFSFDMGQFEEISNEVIRSTHAERKANPLIVPVRVDMIVTAAIITRRIIGLFDISQLKLSVYALKEGLLYHV